MDQITHEVRHQKWLDWINQCSCKRQAANVKHFFTPWGVRTVFGTMRRIRAASLSILKHLKDHAHRGFRSIFVYLQTIVFEIQHERCILHIIRHIYST